MVGELVPFPWLPQRIPTPIIAPGVRELPSAIAALSAGPMTPGNTTSQRATQQMINQLLAGGNGVPTNGVTSPAPNMTGVRSGVNPNPLRALGADTRPVYGPNPVASLADDAAKAAGLTGLLSSVKGVAGKQVLPNITGLKRAGLGLGATLGADLLANQVDPEGGILSRTLKGAGQGAGAGLLSKNPYVVAGGALGGGVLGALGILGGKGKGSSGLDLDKVRTFAQGAGMSQDELDGMLAFYELDKDANGKETANANLMTRLQTVIGQMEMASVQAEQERQAQARMLASQALAGQFFQPFAQQMISSAQQRHQAMQNILPSLPANYRGIAAAQSAGALDNATRMATAYQAQAQMIPAMSMMQQQNEQVNSIAAQLLQQGYQGAITGQSGATNLAELLTQAG